MKDWSKERWRKLYVREAVEQRAWSVVARGLRDYLIRVAEDDGALIRDADDPIDALMRALGAHAGEAELVRASLRLLQEDGFLRGSTRSLFVCNLPAAQAWEHRDVRPASPPPETAAPLEKTRPKSSKERVRQFRERQRLASGDPRDTRGGSEQGRRRRRVPSDHHVTRCSPCERSKSSRGGSGYGQRWYRLWHFFLHWSALIGEQGSAFTLQLIMHKNSESFDRHALRFGGGHIR